MAQIPIAYLIVEKGAPYPEGTVLPLSGDTFLLGRDLREQNGADFVSYFVSRRHAVIECRNGELAFTSLPEARHGTTVNGALLEPGKPCRLNANDRIGLAREAVVLVFMTADEPASETWDYPAPQPAPPVPPQPTLSESAKPEPSVAFDPERREVVVDGVARTLTERLFKLFSVLYENRGRYVKDLEIKQVVWSDYQLGVDGKPLVTDQELTTLKYRLSQLLEPHGDLIRNLRGYGYMLDLPP